MPPVHRTVDTVVVLAKQCDVTVDQLSKSKWRVTGEFERKTIQAEDRSRGGALSRWREKAKYQENFHE